MRTRTLCLIASVALVACSSIDGYKVVHDANGEVTDVKNVGGLPIVVHTPTRALFVLTTTRYNATRVTLSQDAAGEVSMSRESIGEIVESTLSAQPVLVGPAEVYAIDPKRPAAGTIDYELELENQYPKRVKGALTDQTIEQLRELAKQLAETALQAAGLPAGAVAKQSGATRLEKEVVSSKVSLVLIDLRTGGVEIKPLN